MRRGPEGAEVLASSGEFAAQSLFAGSHEFASQVLYLLCEGRETVIRRSGGRSQNRRHGRVDGGGRW